MTDNIQRCPLILHEIRICRCLQVECAWYDGFLSQCSILTIAKALREMKDHGIIAYHEA